MRTGRDAGLGDGAALLDAQGAGGDAAAARDGGLGGDDDVDVVAGAGAAEGRRGGLGELANGLGLGDAALALGPAGALARLALVVGQGPVEAVGAAPGAAVAEGGDVEGVRGGLGGVVGDAVEDAEAGALLLHAGLDLRKARERSAGDRAGIRKGVGTRRAAGSMMKENLSWPARPGSSRIISRTRSSSAVFSASSSPSSFFSACSVAT